MSLKERISADMKTALRARDSQRLSAIRLLLSAIQQKEIDERITLDDAQTIAVINRMGKQRRDSIAQFERAGREDLAARERFELEVLGGYLPQPIRDDELPAAVDAAIVATAASGPQDMGKVMGTLSQQFAGRADLSKVSALVRARLAALHT